MSAPAILIVGAVVAAILVAVVPRALLGRAQDRLARRLLEQAQPPFELLTRAELCAGNIDGSLESSG